MVNCKSSIEDKKKMGLREPQPPFFLKIIYSKAIASATIFYKLFIDLATNLTLTEVLEGDTYRGIQPPIFYIC
jgi:hypothetical protein